MPKLRLTTMSLDNMNQTCNSLSLAVSADRISRREDVKEDSIGTRTTSILMSKDGLVAFDTLSRRGFRPELEEAMPPLERARYTAFVQRQEQAISIAIVSDMMR